MVSASTMPSTVPSLKPRVFSTASSGVRSRTDCIITVPTESSRAKNTAPMIARTTKPMSPICLIWSWTYWPWVAVLVSCGELANRASTALETWPAWVGSPTRIISRLAVPFWLVRPSST